ncbi:AhpD-like protein [Lipomyces oligophaga]|uniref:AhpD-like protein n=1 Tax=Lipomyces oligophaga TaxID=45792 RepID=UPI0034CE0391
MKSTLTPAVLASLRATPLLASSWYYIAAATFSVCNQPEAVPIIFKYAIENDAGTAGQSIIIDRVDYEEPSAKSGPNRSVSPSSHYGSEDESLIVDTAGKDPVVVQKIVRQLREALLKGSALGGLPKTINALIQLRNATPPQFRDAVPFRNAVLPDGHDSIGSVSSPEEVLQEVNRGKEFWDQVYGKVARRVMGQMNSAYPDLGQYALSHIYAPLLSYTGILSAKETSFVVVACLVPQDVNPQLKGHLRGGLNNGATVEEMMSVRDLSMRICKLCNVSWTEEPAKL